MDTTERAVTRLTETLTEYTDSGPIERPPLIEWLEQSITEVMKRGGAGSGGTGLPLGFEALRLLERIERETAWMREALYRPRAKGWLTISVCDIWTRIKELRGSGDVPDGQWGALPKVSRTGLLRSLRSRISAPTSWRSPCRARPAASAGCSRSRMRLRNDGTRCVSNMRKGAR